MKLINLTGRELKIYDQTQTIYTILPASGDAAWVPLEQEKVGDIGTIPIFYPKSQEVQNLPPPEDDKIFVVKLAVRRALPDRHDLMSPGSLVYNNKKVDGCIGLQVNSLDYEFLQSP